MVDVVTRQNGQDAGLGRRRVQVLVTGASGALGSALGTELTARGHGVLRASHRDRPGFLRLDLEADGPPAPADAVVHCAADPCHNLCPDDAVGTVTWAEHLAGR